MVGRRLYESIMCPATEFHLMERAIIFSFVRGGMSELENCWKRKLYCRNVNCGFGNLKHNFKEKHVESKPSFWKSDFFSILFSLSVSKE